jgi:hypothetical protein
MAKQTTRIRIPDGYAGCLPGEWLHLESAVGSGTARKGRLVGSYAASLRRAMPRVRGTKKPCGSPSLLLLLLLLLLRGYQMTIMCSPSMMIPTLCGAELGPCGVFIICGRHAQPRQPHVTTREEGGVLHISQGWHQVTHAGGLDSLCSSHQTPGA